MKKEQSLRIKIAKIALNLLVQWFESVTTLENTYWHLFVFKLNFSIKKAQTPYGIWVCPTCIY
jgi:hypothetical protein